MAKFNLIRRLKYRFGIYGGKSHNPRGLILFIIIFSIIASAISFTEKRLASVAERVAVSDVENAVSRDCNHVTEKILSESGIDINSAISETYNGENRITSVSSDFSELNALKTKIADEITLMAGKAHTVTCRVPSGSLVSDGIFAGYGFDIPLKFIVTGTGFVNFNNSFESTGINQSRYRIDIEVIVDAEVHTVFNSYPKRIAVTIPLVEKIIVGDTPAGILDAR